jgi:hypothetical protein
MEGKKRVREHDWRMQRCGLYGRALQNFGRNELRIITAEKQEMRTGDLSSLISSGGWKNGDVQYCHLGSVGYPASVHA